MTAKLNTKLVSNNKGEQRQRFRNESNKFDLKVTHFFMHNKFITAIPGILRSSSENLTAIYLHDNNIDKIENINSAYNLKVLYLHNNKIKKIEGLDGLRNLQKLYLGRNEISVVEGLQNLTNLIELRIEKQRLKINDSLCFDPRTIATIGEHIKVLDISCNNIRSILNLSSFKNIETIEAGHNKLTDIEELCKTISDWCYLRVANFTGNPLTKRIHYREDIIAASYRLSWLDSKRINEETRFFMKRLQQERRILSSHGCNRNIKSTIEVPDLGRSYALPLQKTVSREILKNTISFHNEDDINNEDPYLPWNALPKICQTVHPFVVKFKMTQDSGASRRLP